MKIKNLLLLVALTSLLALISNAQDMGKIDPIVQKQIGASLTSYYTLKDALVDSDADKANLAAEELLKTFGAIDASKMNAAQRSQWEKHGNSLRIDARHISENEDIAHQRDHFKKLSDNMHAIVVAFKANNAETYWQYCPMKKASWLSNSKDIRNPYYGSRMLTCGSVKATLKKN